MAGRMRVLIVDMVRLASQGVNTTGGSQSSVEFAVALHVGEEDDDLAPHATARLVLAAAANASLLSWKAR